MKLTPEEKTLLGSIENGEGARIPDFAKEAVRYRESARAMLQNKPKHTLLYSILIGLAIVMVAVAVAVLYCWNQISIQRRDNTRLSIQEIEKAIEIYARKHNGKLPDTLHEMLHSEEHPGEHITDCLTGAIYSFTDCWDTPFNYQKEGATFKLRSAGPDRILDTPDDITN